MRPWPNIHFIHFFWRVKPENITGLLASLHQPDMCYIKRGFHSCLVQGTKTKTKQRTNRLIQTFNLLQTIVTEVGPGSSFFKFFFLWTRSAHVLFCFRKEQFMLLLQMWGSTQTETEWTTKIEQRTKVQTYLKLRLLSKAYCSSVPLISYREHKQRQYHFLQFRERKNQF